MATIRRYDPSNKSQMIRTLRREIMAARLKVALDKELKRETSATVKSLAGMILPPVVRQNCYTSDAQSDFIALKAADIRAGRRRTIPADEVRRDLGLED
ncbi:hypothetical protein AS189_00555 [Arthrobacter alpinus]|uniref:Uncharacterized protein n=1 Tax=Arthrobacter alpinus TaxID=656366 RepID=A0A0S2LV33_9MICC|nr:hypothetical protein [Arthrobacter alpinus]ALO65250.1 hypothetical protein AS189_00555 [Arthrobacter alpinus]